MRFFGQLNFSGEILETMQIRECLQTIHGRSCIVTASWQYDLAAFAYIRALEIVLRNIVFETSKADVLGVCAWEE